MTKEPSSSKDTSRKPAVFSVDDPKVSIAEHTQDTFLAKDAKNEESEVDDDMSSQSPSLAKLRWGFTWGTIFFTALGALASLAFSLWLTSFVRDLFTRQDWVGWLALSLLAIACIAAVMILLKELFGLARLRRIARIRDKAESALRDNDKTVAMRVLCDLKSLFASRTDLSWAIARLSKHEGDVLAAKEFLVLAERELMTPLDQPARAIIAASAKRVSLITAISPAALLDMAVVGVENLRMLRRLAILYGGRPGAIGLFRIAKMVIGHLVLTGGMALSQDLIQQIIGQKLTAKLSARLGEGLFNGAMTTRIGITALEVCRPLPFIEAPKPRLREFALDIFKPKTPDETSHKST